MADYLYGKKRLREIDRRMRFLTKRLDIAEVVDPAAQPNRDQVFFGATVLYMDRAGEERTVTIVGVDEAEPLAGKISWISPVARALTKAHEGDTVTLVHAGRCRRTGDPGGALPGRVSGRRVSSMETDAVLAG